MEYVIIYCLQIKICSMLYVFDSVFRFSYKVFTYFYICIVKVFAASS